MIDRCEMLHVYPGDDGHGIEAPCRNLADYDERMRVCTRCLSAILDEEALDSTEKRTIEPITVRRWTA